MTKAELVNKIAKDSHISKRAAERFVDSFVSSVQQSLRKGKKVTLVGFGTFGVVRRAARAGRNPQTGAVIRIPAVRVARFRAGKQLKVALLQIGTKPPTPRPQFPDRRGENQKKGEGTRHPKA